MHNPLFHPELREMLTEHDDAQMREFCDSLHPARAAEFLDGLEAQEIWEVLRHCDEPQRAEIFSYFDIDTQAEILRTAPREEMGRLVSTLPSDDRVDVLKDLDEHTAGEIIQLLPPETRRDVLRLQAFPEGTCGSIMSSDFVRLDENMTVNEAIKEIGSQSHVHETIYYLYVLDQWDHLVGLVSAKQLLAATGKGETRIRELMERDLITVKALDDDEQAADDIAKYDLVAVPVVDEEHRMLGIITYDDVIDLNREEATKDAYQMGAVSPMEEAYLEAPFWTIWKKRVFWLSCLFVAELFTFSALAVFEDAMAQYLILALFVPLCISTGGNSGSQAATLITRSLAIGEVKLKDWLRVMRHELLMGIALGCSLGLIAFLRAYCTSDNLLGGVDRGLLALTIAQSVMMICLCGTLIGAMLPLLFKRIGVDPAIASSPFVATFVDVSGIVIYFSIAKFWLLSGTMAFAPLANLPTVSIEFSLAEDVPEARSLLQNECYATLSDVKGVRFFCMVDAVPQTEPIETLVTPLSEIGSFQTACMLVFDDKEAYSTFVVSSRLDDLLERTQKYWQNRRVVHFDVKAEATSSRH